MQKLYGIVCDIFVAVCHQAQVEEWERKLLVFSRTLDEWLTCQRNWLYLEQIFSTPDIQRWVHPRVAVSWDMTKGGLCKEEFASPGVFFLSLVVQHERSLLLFRADVCRACDLEAVCAGLPDGAAKLCCCMCKKRGLSASMVKSTLKRNGLLLLIGILVFKVQSAPFRQMTVYRLETSLYW